MPGEGRAGLFRGGALDFDAQASARALAKADPRLGRVIERVGTCTLRPNGLHSPFSALVESITYQQLHGKAAATILGRVVALYRPKRFPEPKQVLDTPEAALRAAGLSGSKLAAIRDLAAKTLDGTVPTLARLERMADEEIVERLTSIRGVGRWTVEMLLIFRLGRPDVLPAGDYGVRKGFAAAYGWDELPSPAALLEHGERWRPHRTVASWYLWRAADLPNLAGRRPSAKRSADPKAKRSAAPKAKRSAAPRAKPPARRKPRAARSRRPL
jgi:DNA-3-methyladenine glycosylase II